MHWDIFQYGSHPFNLLQDWSCPLGSPMNPVKKCEVWWPDDRPSTWFFLIAPIWLFDSVSFAASYTIQQNFQPFDIKILPNGLLWETSLAGCLPDTLQAEDDIFTCAYNINLLWESPNYVGTVFYVVVLKIVRFPAKLCWCVSELPSSHCTEGGTTKHMFDIVDYRHQNI